MKVIVVYASTNPSTSSWQVAELPLRKYAAAMSKESLTTASVELAASYEHAERFILHKTETKLRMLLPAIEQNFDRLLKLCTAYETGLNGDDLIECKKDMKRSENNHEEILIRMKEFSQE